MNEIDFINAKMNRQNVQTPQFLYKYRSFDEHTFDMLENAYVYLCPAERLDAPSECKVDFTVQDFYDLKTNRLTFMGVEMMLSFIKPYTTEKNFQYIRSIVAHTLMPQGAIRRHFLLDASFEIQELVPNTDITPVINWLGSIPDKLNDPNIKYKFIELFSLAHDARRDMGICSLSELNNSDEMWKVYADGAKGYCIEYDMRGYESLYALYPVVYQDNRENNIVMSILSSFIGEMIVGMSNEQIDVDGSQFVRLFITKDLVWSYQKEWRLLGDANQKLSAPSVNAIYLGKNMPEQCKQQIIDYCKSHDIKVE